MATLCPVKMRGKYLFVSSLVLAAATTSGAFTVISAILNMAEDIYPAKYIYIANEIFAAGFVISTMYLSIVFFFWAYTVSKSLIAQGISVETTPVWAVVWFFVPIFNLFKPYKSMVDFWCKTMSDSSIDGKYKIIKIWWAVFIFSAILSKIALQMQLNVHNLASHELARAMYAVSIIANVIYVVVLIQFIKRFSAHFAAFCSAGRDVA